VGGCIDLKKLVDDHQRQPTYERKIIRTRKYPGARWTLDRPFQQMACMCGACTLQYDCLGELEPGSFVDPRRLVFLRKTDADAAAAARAAAAAALDEEETPDIDVEGDGDVYSSSSFIRE
jgi:hypothetical protein